MDNTLTLMRRDDQAVQEPLNNSSAAPMNEIEIPSNPNKHYHHHRNMNTNGNKLGRDHYKGGNSCDKKQRS
ncbi:hypothetical protein N7489_011755 [Penicillium chrysogenum]|uniref:Uncharacterized protein n=1 Tax=Penicillium chrysogenum TaxID=5076 RepID=A0ABQ8W0C1_PENCH|nr:uncharacterized protein N7489_011755 [Penicillium chrysogenum]XP_061070584.1 uncharacterized protein N7525_005956 [Penicillium rubens]KAJ5231047.1 hypothetical protein N7489_011755 [Penicillium chrysogenum]KAJ5253375.1 hypothetical protein N7505_012038 [Penicillium chrysogenum]KAJ5268431.1 hypothetical protein N7524_005890 [Penicillium chrysogenum]KAJ5840768.1 hypothetical protein N7525_005956 [Penicillium rubens]